MTRYLLISVLLIGLPALAACGGGGAETVTVVSTASEGSEEPRPAEAAGGEAGENGVDVISGPNAVYLPNAVGGNFHQVLAIVRNTTDKALRIDAQFTIKDARGLVGTSDAYTTVLAGQEGLLLSDAVDLPRPVRKGNVTVVTATGEPLVTDSALLEPGALTLGKPSLGKGGAFGTCEFRSVVTNNTSEKLEITQVQFVAVKEGAPVAGAYTYPSLFPKTPKVVTSAPTSDALCPEGATIKGYWSP
jgi:hypothetical protein